MYGRGACDMKGGVASILGAVRALRDDGTLHLLDGELMVVLVPSEEDGGQGTLAAIRAGATGDMAIITEPSALDVVVAHAGAITFRLSVPGRAAHASQRREGVSALDNLFTLLRALETDEVEPERRGNGPADDRPRPAVPDDRGNRVRRRVGVDGPRPGDGRRSLRRSTRAVAGRGRGGPARLHRGGVCRRRLPARPPRHGRIHRRPVRVRARAVRPRVAGRAGGDGRDRSRVAGRLSWASRTAPTCRCSSTTAGRRA